MLASSLLCLVIGISDGDTLTARCGQPEVYVEVSVQLAGTDAPEVKQPFGQRSKKSLRTLCYLTKAKITQHTTDRDGRAVADVQCRGKDAGREQVLAGLAWVNRQYDRGYEHLYQLEDTAQRVRRGLWNEKTPVPPWEWRKGKRGG